MACRLLLPAFVTILIIVGASTPTWAADLGIQVNPDRESSRFYVTYQKTVLIEYPEGGLIRDQLNGLDWQVAGSADSSNPGVQDLTDQMNRNILDSGSRASISDLDVSYDIHLRPFDGHTSIDYYVLLKGHISDYIIMKDSQRALIDIGWRGLGAHDDVVIDGVDVNRPIGILESRLPETYELLAGTAADKVLLQPVIHVGYVREQSMADWHFHREKIVPQPDPKPYLEYIPIWFDYYWTLGELKSGNGEFKVNHYSEYVPLDRLYFLHGIQP